MATAKRASKKSTSKKKSAAAKSTAKKTQAKKVTKKSDSTQMVTLEKLRKFNIFAAVSSLIFAVLSVVFLSNDSFTFTVPYSVKDDLASSDATVLGPAYQNFVTVELRYLLAVVFGLAAILSILLATKLRAKYEKGVASKVSALRWIFLGIISALTLEITSILGGVGDLVTLKLIAGLILVTSLLGWVSEAKNKNNEKKFGVFYISLFTGFLAWIPLIFSFFGTSIWGMQHFSWYVYTLAAFVLVGFSNLALTQYKYLRDGASSAEYLDFEGKYVSTEFLIRLSLFVIVFIAFFK